MTATELIFNQLISGEKPVNEQSINKVSLPFERRQRSRLRISVAQGPLSDSSVGIDLPRGTVMRAGALLACTVQEQPVHYLQVDAAPEALLEVSAGTTAKLTAIAYHLGNRHVPVQVGDQWLRLLQDHVLENMVLGLGGQVQHINAAFEPEAGAYHGGHHHHHGEDDDHHHSDDQPMPDHRHAPRIHDLANPEASA